MTIILKLNHDWDKIKRMLKAKYPALLETDLEFNEGQENFLVAKLASKLKLPEEEIRAILFKMKVGVEIEEMEDVAVV